MSAQASVVKRLFRIQYASDLHLEFYEKLAFPTLLKPNARYLALAGDIGRPGHHVFNSFLRYVSERWDHVFYVTGNHEYYDEMTHASAHLVRQQLAHQTLTSAILGERKFIKPMEVIHDEIRNSALKYPNIHVLDRENPSYYIAKDNVAIVGLTLWTHIPPHLFATASNGMADYKYISKFDRYNIPRPLNPADTTVLHEMERTVLEEQIAFWESQKIPTCVITHHMPSETLISPRFAGSALNACFASNCEYLMRPNVKIWMYGHTHNCSSSVIKKTLCVSNARGYPKEHVAGYLPSAWAEIPILEDESPSVSDLAASAVGIRDPYMK